MRRPLLTLAFVLLIACFSVLVVDFIRFVTSGGIIAYFSLVHLLPQAIIDQIDTWAALEGSTWGNINRIGLRPLLMRTPIWLALLLLALILRYIGRSES